MALYIKDILLLNSMTNTPDENSADMTILFLLIFQNIEIAYKCYNLLGTLTPSNVFHNTASLHIRAAI
jgi:hypothetical protein